jgi:hypothetical protein
MDPAGASNSIIGIALHFDILMPIIAQLSPQFLWVNIIFEKSSVGVTMMCDKQKKE